MPAHARSQGESEVEVVLRFFRTLPPAQQQVMAWLFDGYETWEIAENAGMKVSTVRSNMRHAREHLRSLWEAEKKEVEAR